MSDNLSHPELIKHIKARHADEMAARDSYTRTVAVLALAIGLAIGALCGVLASDEILPRGSDVGVARGR